MLESIEKLRESLKDCTNKAGVEPNRFDTYWITAKACDVLIDEVEAEIAERYMPLPVDADGVPIRLGDTMKGVDKYDSLQEVTGEVIEVSFIRTDNGECVASVGVQVWAKDKKSWHCVYLDPYADIYHHVKERTIEDVLVRFLSSCGDDDPHFYDEEIREYADELREMLGSDAE